MELKSFIRTLKMQRGRYSKNPNAAAEKKTIENLAEKIGGKLEAIAQLKEAGEDDLKDYIKGVFGIKTVVSDVEPTPTTDTEVEEVEVVDENSVTGEKKKVGRPKKEEKQYEEKNDQRYPLLFYGSWYAGRMRQQLHSTGSKRGRQRSK